MSGLPTLSRAHLQWPPASGPTRVLQLGEGRFLRSFAAPLLAEMAQSEPFRVLMTNMRPQGSDAIRGMKRQDGLYMVMLADTRGREDCLVSWVDPADVSEDWEDLASAAGCRDCQLFLTNGTEASMQGTTRETWPDPPGETLVERLVLLLKERWRLNPDAPLIILPTELVPNNGQRLKQLVCETAARWEANGPFATWLEDGPHFLNTLVDRIVVGTPGDIRRYWDEWGYVDHYASLAERYGRWWIEGLPELFAAFPLHRVPGVELVTDIQPYESLKLFLLNGAHVGIAALGVLRHHATVQEAMEDSEIRNWVEDYWRVAAVAVPLPRPEVERFLVGLRHRFRNPAIPHRLIDIAQNLPMKWRVRVAPVIQHWWTSQGDVPRTLAQLTRAVGLSIGGASVEEVPQLLWGEGFPNEPPWAARLAVVMADSWGPEAPDRIGT